MNKNAALYVKDVEAREQLIPLAIETVQDEQKLHELSEQILKMALPGSAEIIADEVIRLAERRRG